MEFCVFELVSEQNFNLNLQFWIFAPNLPKKRYSQLKTEQAVLGLQASTFCVINFNSTVVFKHFEDLRDLIILNINNFIMISKVMIKFRSKFQFQIPLQFYKIVEKILTSTTIFSTSPLLLLFCFFMIEMQAYWILRYFDLTNKIFTKKNIVQE